MLPAYWWCLYARHVGHCVHYIGALHCLHNGFARLWHLGTMRRWVTWRMRDLRPRTHVHHGNSLTSITACDITIKGLDTWFRTSYSNVTFGSGSRSQAGNIKGTFLSYGFVFHSIASWCMVDLKTNRLSLRTFDTGAYCMTFAKYYFRCFFVRYVMWLSCVRHPLASAIRRCVNSCLERFWHTGRWNNKP